VSSSGPRETKKTLVILSFISLLSPLLLLLYTEDVVDYQRQLEEEAQLEREEEEKRLEDERLAMTGKLYPIYTHNAYIYIYIYMYLRVFR